jgi:hypothetical protein
MNDYEREQLVAQEEQLRNAFQSDLDYYKENMPDSAIKHLIEEECLRRSALYQRYNWIVWEFARECSGEYDEAEPLDEGDDDAEDAEDAEEPVVEIILDSEDPQ